MVMPKPKKDTHLKALLNKASSTNIQPELKTKTETTVNARSINAVWA